MQVFQDMHSSRSCENIAGLHIIASAQLICWNQVHRNTQFKIRLTLDPVHPKPIYGLGSPLRVLELGLKLLVQIKLC